MNAKSALAFAKVNTTSLPLMEMFVTSASRALAADFVSSPMWKRKDASTSAGVSALPS